MLWLIHWLIHWWTLNIVYDRKFNVYIIDRFWTCCLQSVLLKYERDWMNTTVSRILLCVQTKALEAITMHSHATCTMSKCVVWISAWAFLCVLLMMQCHADPQKNRQAQVLPVCCDLVCNSTVAQDYDCTATVTSLLKVLLFLFKLNSVCTRHSCMVIFRGYVVAVTVICDTVNNWVMNSN